MRWLGYRRLFLGDFAVLAKRIIPSLLCRGRQLIKGIAFDSWRSVGLAAQAARIHSMRGVDELLILDIGATPENRSPDLQLIEELSETCFMPVTVGGGIKSIQDITNLLHAGADKVCIGTSAIEIPGLIAYAAGRFGSQAIMVSIDVSVNHVFSRCGQEVTTWSPVEFAIHMEQQGAGEILLTAIDHEGTQNGYDLELIAEVSNAVSIPVIAAGGCGSYAHMLQAIKEGASAVSAGAFFQFTDATPKGAAEYLHNKGIEVRL